jgi:hypothetical protein
VAIRLNTPWSYIAEWRIGRGNQHPGQGGGARSDSDAEREASDEILKAHLLKEPWLYAEIACIEKQESDL